MKIMKTSITLFHTKFFLDALCAVARKIIYAKRLSCVHVFENIKTPEKIIDCFFLQMKIAPQDIQIFYNCLNCSHLFGLCHEIDL